VQHTINNTPRTAETGTSQACQQVHRFAAVSLHPAKPVQKLQHLNDFEQQTFHTHYSA